MIRETVVYVLQLGTQLLSRMDGRSRKITTNKGSKMLMSYDEFMKAIGKYEGRFEGRGVWVPPTDDERKMFMAAAKYYKDTGSTPKEWQDVWDMCFVNRWNLQNTGRYANQHLAEIAESLAMDGL